METDIAQTEVEQQTCQYTNLKKELIEIATILEKYPESLRTRVFEVLLNAYLMRFAVVPNPTNLVTDQDLDEPLGDQDVQGDLVSSAAADQIKQVKTRKRAPDSYSIDPDLNLHGGEGIPSFEEFVIEKRPNSNAEFNTVAVYYITKILKKPQATLKQAWTCYKDVKRRTPEFFKQSFTDTKNKTGNIKFTEAGDLELSGRGENFIEHDLPPKGTP